MSRIVTTMILIVIVASVVAVASTLYLGQNVLSSPVPTMPFMSSPQVSPGTTATPNPTSVQIALVSLSNKAAQPKTFGCGDSVIFIETDTNNNSIKSAFEKLFSLQDRDVDQNLYNALSNSQLQFDRLEQTSEGLKIYLTGDLSLAGVCDNPRVSQQLIQTAQQNSTADNIEIFINNKKLEEALSLNEG